MKVLLLSLLAGGGTITTGVLLRLLILRLLTRSPGKTEK